MGNYIFDITSKGANNTYNTVTNISRRLKFDGSIDDKKELLKICRIMTDIITDKVKSIKYCKNGDKSYTDGEHITISSKIEEKSYDSTIGLALHEASHIAITDFDFWYSTLDALKKSNPKHMSLIKSLFNWIEDRRIDGWVYGDFPNQRPYYEALYRRYFLSAKVEKLIKSGKMKNKETINNYMFYICNHINPLVSMTELQALPRIKDIIDLDNIMRLESTQDAYEVAMEIYKEMIKYLDNPKDDEMETNDDRDMDDDDEDGEGFGEQLESLEDEELEELIREFLKDLLGRLEDFGDGTIDNDTFEEISEDEQKELDEKENEENIGKGKATQTNINIEGLNLIYTPRTPKEAFTNGNHKDYTCIFTNKNTKTKESVKKGISIGKRLKDNLRFRDEKRVSLSLNQKNGNINRSKLHTCVTDPERIFYTKTISKYERTNLHISVDASDSMSWDDSDGLNKWQETITLVSAIAYAVTGMEGVDIQVSYRYTSDYGNDIYCTIVYDSRYNTVNDIKLLGFTKPNGGTPEGLCYKALNDNLLSKIKVKNQLFINFSDGEPYYKAIEPTKKAIRQFEKSGYEVLSYFIGGNELSDTFTDMYGVKNSFLVSTDNVRGIIKVLNKKLLNIGKNGRG